MLSQRPTSFGERLDARVQREQEHYGQGTTELLINTTIPAVAVSSLFPFQGANCAS